MTCIDIACFNLRSMVSDRAAGHADDVLDKFGWLSAEFVNRDYMDSGRDETDVSEPETILEEASAKLGRWR